MQFFVYHAVEKHRGTCEKNIMCAYFALLLVHHSDHTDADGIPLGLHDRKGVLDSTGVSGGRRRSSSAWFGSGAGMLCRCICTTGQRAWLRESRRQSEVENNSSPAGNSGVAANPRNRIHIMSLHDLYCDLGCVGEAARVSRKSINGSVPISSPGETDSSAR